MHRRTFLQSNLPLAAYLVNGASIRLSQLTSSTASLSGMTFTQALRKIRQMGFEGVDILTFEGARHSVGPIPGAVVARLTETEKRQLRSEVAGFQHVSTHLPFHDLRPVATDL